MGNVVFFATNQMRGSVKVPAHMTVTGLAYVITPQGTPVSEYDAAVLDSMYADPCCGMAVPFQGQVKLFGKTSASIAQMNAVPQYVKDARPPKLVTVAVEEEKPRSRAKIVEVEDKTVKEKKEEESKRED